MWQQNRNMKQQNNRTERQQQLLCRQGLSRLWARWVNKQQQQQQLRANSFTQSYGSSWSLKIEIALARTESGVAATKEGTLPILLLLFIILKRLSDLPMRSEVICVCVCVCVCVSEFTCLPKVEAKKVVVVVVVVVGQTNNNCVTFVDKPRRRRRSEDHYHHHH